MEELIRLSITYYNNTVSIRYYGIVGLIYLLVSLPFIILSFYITINLKMENLGVLPMCISFGFWLLAKKNYDERLVRHLSYYTHLESNNIKDHKAIYLQYLTSHISDNLYETMKKLQTVIEIDKKSKVLGLGNGWSHFKKFLYDPESKSRIISLLVYLGSIFALLIIIKGNSEVTVYPFLDAISISFFNQYLFMSIFLILLGYVVVVIPISFIKSFLIYPLLLNMSVTGALVNHFITELNRYSFREQ